MMAGFNDKGCTIKKTTPGDFYWWGIKQDKSKIM